MEILDEPGPLRPCYLHKTIILTSVKQCLQPVPNTLSKLVSENSMDKVIMKNLTVGGFTGLRHCNIIRKCLIEEKLITTFCLFFRTQCAYRYFE